MSVKKPRLGLRTGASSDRWLAPPGPQTGDGKTRRHPHDARDDGRVTVTMKTANQR